MQLGIGLLLVLGGAVLAACAHGAQLDETSGPGGSGAGGDTSSSAQASGGGPSSGGPQVALDGVAGAGGVGGAPPTCTYTAPDTCETAQELQSIDGDRQHDTRVVLGTTSAWMAIEVKEAVGSLLRFPQLSYRVTLESPPGMVYHLFVYRGDATGPGCGAQPREGEGDPPEVTQTWIDIPGFDDSTWLAIEVRHIQGGLCGTAAQWTLTVEGHNDP
jgi:hypothetical protein